LLGRTIYLSLKNEPMNLNPFVMFPIALVDLALFGEVVRRRRIY